MKKRLVQSLIVAVFAAVIFLGTESNKIHAIGYETDSPFAGVSNIVPILDTLSIVEDNDIDIVAEPEIPEIETSELYLSYINMGYSSEDFYDDLELLAEITIAEAGNQSELGKRLVIDVILNRIDSDRWRDDYTISEVVTHPGQFETYINGAYASVELDETVCQLVEEEILNRTNTQVMYFRTDYYFDGLPALFQEGDHYFSGDSV